MSVSQSASTAGAGNVIVQIVGDGSRVEPQVPHLELTRYAQRRVVRELDGYPLAADLVSAYSESIELRGREAAKADLQSWISGASAISVRVLVGSAGRGKTRLALEQCKEVTAAGWRAGFLTTTEMRRFRAQQNLAGWGWNAPVLVVVDYVASQAELLHEWLVELAENSARSDGEAASARPLRLLLLERQADVGGGWWQTVFGRGG